MIVSIFVCVSASKTSDNSKITIHFYSKDWSNPNIYYWNSKPKNVEVVLTGRNAHQAVIDIADLVSNIQPIKHYWNKGVQAREGIEY